MRTLEEKSILLRLTMTLCWFANHISTSSGWLNNLTPTEAQTCSTSEDCDRSSGQVCLQMYDGCPKGLCMCDLRLKFVPSGDSNSPRCVPMRFGMETCSAYSRCRDGMTCRNGMCRCLSGKMTSDRLHCLSHNGRLLGERCSSKEKCHQKAASGYTTDDVSCSSNGVCACAEGYKTNGLSCQRRRVYEDGCRKSYHCEGGAICINSRCLCPIGYGVPIDGFKCIRNGARYNVSVGEECDEINEKRYCATDLVCHKCASEEVFYCVEFLLASDFSPEASIAASSVSLSIFPIAMHFAITAAVR